MIRGWPDARRQSRVIGPEIFHAAGEIA